LVAEHGARATQHLAYQALGEWTPEQREALRTLAAASPEVRAQAFSDGSESAAGFGASSEPPLGTASSGTGAAAAPQPRSASGNGENGARTRSPQDQSQGSDKGGGS
jgi:hypothetical protein